MVITILVPGLQPWNALFRRLLPQQSPQEAGASVQCVPRQEPRNKEKEPKK